MPIAGSILAAPPEIIDFLTNIRLVTQSYANHISYLRRTSSFLVGPMVSLLSIGFTLNNRFRIAQQISFLPLSNRTQKRVQTRSPSITSMYPGVADNIPLQVVKTQLSSLKVLNQVYEHKLNKSTPKEQGIKSTVPLPPDILPIQRLSASGRVDELSNNTILNEMISPLRRVINSFSVGHAPSIALTRLFGSKPKVDRGISYWYFNSLGSGLERHLSEFISKKRSLTNNLQAVRSSFNEFLAQATAIKVDTTTSFTTSLLTIVQGLRNTGFQTSAQTVGTITRGSKSHLEQLAVIEAFPTFYNLDRILPVNNIFPIKDLERIIGKESFSYFGEPNKFGWGNIGQSIFLSSPAVEQAYSQIKLPSVLSRKLDNSILKLANNGLPITTFLNFEGEMQVTRAIQFVNNSSQRTLSDANLKVLQLFTGIPGQAKYPPVKSKNRQSEFYGDLLLGSFNQTDSLVGQLNAKKPQLNFYRNLLQLGVIPMTNRSLFKLEPLAAVAKILTNYSHISATEQLKWVGRKNLALQKTVQNNGFSITGIISDHTATYDPSYLPFRSAYWFPHQNFISIISNRFPSIKRLITSLDLHTVREFTIASQTSTNEQMMNTSHLIGRSATMQEFHDNKSSFNGLSNTFNINSEQTMIEPASLESSKLQQPNIIEIGGTTKNPSVPNKGQYEMRQRYEQDSEIRSFQAQIERIFSEESIKFDALHDNRLPAVEFSRFNIDDNVSEINGTDAQYDEEAEIKTLKRKIEQLLEEELRRHGYIPW
jgi:hypothetical protein